jgi:hypothetical protein
MPEPKARYRGQTIVWADRAFGRYARSDPDFAFDAWSETYEEMERLANLAERVGFEPTKSLHP